MHGVKSDGPDFVPTNSTFSTDSVTPMARAETCVIRPLPTRPSPRAHQLAAREPLGHLFDRLLFSLQCMGHALQFQCTGHALVASSDVSRAETAKIMRIAALRNYYTFYY